MWYSPVVPQTALSSCPHTPTSPPYNHFPSLRQQAAVVPQTGFAYDFIQCKYVYIWLIPLFFSPLRLTNSATVSTACSVVRTAGKQHIETSLWLRRWILHIQINLFKPSHLQLYVVFPSNTPLPYQPKPQLVGIGRCAPYTYSPTPRCYAVFVPQTRIAIVKC